MDYHTNIQWYIAGEVNQAYVMETTEKYPGGTKTTSEKYYIQETKMESDHGEDLRL